MKKREIKYSRQEVIPPLNWEFFLTHYVFQPWVREGNSLVRLFKFPSGNLALVRVKFSGSVSNPQVKLELIAEEKLSQSDSRWIKDLVSWCFAFKEPVTEFYDQVCQQDPVLQAASRQIYGAKFRADPDVFESVIGVVVAQNIQFKRIYSMLELLCQRFGQAQRFGPQTYFTFPEPQILAEAKMRKIRDCKVGYRDKYIKGIAEYLVGRGINLNDLRQLEDLKQIREELIKLPGVGPYTADLALALGFRRPTFHVDLFSREAIQTFYFEGKTTSDEKIRDFAERRWGKWKHYAMLLLTTNTEEWAKVLGVDFRLRSGARNPQEVLVK